MILDLQVLNRALHKLPFKMLKQKCIFGWVHPLDWFAAIDLKDAYFHVSILSQHRPFLRFAVEGAEAEMESCSSHQEDPRRCSIRAVLSFLQQGLEQ